EAESPNAVPRLAQAVSPAPTTTAPPTTKPALNADIFIVPPAPVSSPRSPPQPVEGRVQSRARVLCPERASTPKRLDPLQTGAGGLGVGDGLGGDAAHWPDCGRVPFGQIGAHRLVPESTTSRSGHSSSVCGAGGGAWGSTTVTL